MGEEESESKYSYFSMREEEVDFLGRLFDLDSLPSTDGRFKNARGDIWQHTVNNYDWEGMWVKEDSRFLRGCSDETLLNFLAELFHPVVRNDRTLHRFLRTAEHSFVYCSRSNPMYRFMVE